MKIEKILLELVEQIRGVREELIRIEESIRDCAVPRSPIIKVRKEK